MVRGLKLKLFAALLLRAMAQEQAEAGAEAVSPRHPNVARRLGLDPDSPELAIGERYLQEQGYISPLAPRGGRPFRHYAGRLGGPRLPALCGGVAEETLVEEDARGLGRNPCLFAAARARMRPEPRRIPALTIYSVAGG